MSGIPSLERLSIQAVANSLIDQYLLLQQDFINGAATIDAVVAKSKAIIREILIPVEGGNLPEGLYSAVQDYICQYASDIAFLFAMGRGNNISSFRVRSPSSGQFQSFPGAPTAPTPILHAFLENLSSFMTDLKLEGMCLTDEMFAILANSACAKNLRSLRLGMVDISDVSAPLWPKFELLEELVIGEAPWMMRPSLKSIARLQNLRKIKLYGNGINTIDHYFHLLRPNATPALVDFHVEEAQGLELSTISFLIGLMRSRHNAKNMRSVVLGMFPYQKQNAELFQVCPNLQKNTFFFSSLEDIESTGSSAITALNIRGLESPFTDDLLKKLCELCPNLTFLSIRESALQLQTESFSSLTSLKKLEFIGVDGLETVRGYPSTLKTLLFDCCPLQLKADHVEFNSRVVQEVLRDVPHLKEFLSFNTLLLDEKQMEALYRGLKHARVIDTHLLHRTDAKHPVNLNLPSSSLRRFNFDRWTAEIKSHFPVLNYVPSLEELNVRPLLQTKEYGSAATIALSGKALPNLRCLQTGYVENQIESDDLEAQFDKICSLSRSLRHLSLNGDWKQFFANKLSMLRRLQCLQIERVTAFKFEPTMQHLLHLELSRATATDWIHATMRFPHLRRLKFDRASIPGNIVISADQFPSLEHFTLIGIAKGAFEIKDHPTVLSLALNSIFDFSTVEVSGCARLINLVLSNFVGCFKTKIERNANLKSVDMHNCEGVSHAESIFEFAPLHTIRLNTIEKHSHACVEIYKRVVAASKETLLSGLCVTIYDSGNRSILMDPIELSEDPN